MKISKLFHWLYAILMLLPVFFIGGRSLYVVFNKNAKDSYYGETINEQIQVSGFVNDIDTYQYFNLSNVTITGATNFYVSDFRSFGTMVFSQDTTDNVKELLLYEYNSNPYVKLTYNNDLTQFIILSASNKDTTFSFYLRQPMPSNIYSSSFYHIEYNKYSYLDNAFLYSVNELNEVSLFSWAKTSFLVQPFSYITGLFGIETSNPINTLLSYWLSVSIIWLVFDLVMYVPLLVHRWIDKGVLE